MNDKLFQRIFETIQDTLPGGWEKIVFFAAYSEGGYSMKYYVKMPDAGYRDCFDLETVSRAKIVKKFMDLDKLFRASRNSLETDKKWSVFTMTVNAQGKFKTDYAYDDISENFLSYEQEWKKLYLV